MTIEDPVVLRCPIPIDRSVRHGWSGDPASQFVSCDWVVAYIPGAWSEYPNGPRHDRASIAGNDLREHVRSHAVEDVLALTQTARDKPKRTVRFASLSRPDWHVDLELAVRADGSVRYRLYRDYTDGDTLITAAENWQKGPWEKLYDEGVL